MAITNNLYRSLYVDDVGRKSDVGRRSEPTQLRLMSISEDPAMAAMRRNTAAVTQPNAIPEIPPGTGGSLLNRKSWADISAPLR